ncbi:MAG: hypothetical protein K0S32_1111 [Bacteroidetes bacterium]|nr:hypothetical protein [Bacteroidota bacterium]
MDDSLLYDLSQTDCGKKLSAYQRSLFFYKKELLLIFAEYALKKELIFKPLDAQTIFDYMVLELPFTFWQTFKKEDQCKYISDSTVSINNQLVSLIHYVRPQFFSVKKLSFRERAFYMFYHELGYYEYNTEPFKKYLTQTDYSNKRFATDRVTIKFDKSFQEGVNAMMKTDASETIFFVYGEYDPWRLQSSAKKNVFVVKEGSHSSRIKDLPSTEQTVIFDKVKSFMK